MDAAMIMAGKKIADELGLTDAVKDGVRRVLEILDSELEHIMKLAGTTTLGAITRECVV